MFICCVCYWGPHVFRIKVCLTNIPLCWFCHEAAGLFHENNAIFYGVGDIETWRRMNMATFFSVSAGRGQEIGIKEQVLVLHVSRRTSIPYL